MAELEARKSKEELSHR